MEDTKGRTLTACCMDALATKLRTSRSSSQIEQAVRKALESPQMAPDDPSSRGNTSMSATSSTTRTSPPPPPAPPPPPTEARPRRRHRSRIKAGAAHESPPKDDLDVDDASEALILDPLQELFGIQTSKGESTPGVEQRKPRTPVRYFASPPADLTPPPLPSTSTSFRGTTSLPVPSADKLTVNTQAAEPMPEWVLPQLPRSTTSRIIREDSRRSKQERHWPSLPPRRLPQQEPPVSLNTTVWISSRRLALPAIQWRQHTGFNGETPRDEQHLHR